MKILTKIEKLDQTFPGLADDVRQWFGQGISAKKITALLFERYQVSLFGNSHQQFSRPALGGRASAPSGEEDSGPGGTGGLSRAGDAGVHGLPGCGRSGMNGLLDFSGVAIDGDGIDGNRKTRRTVFRARAAVKLGSTKALRRRISRNSFRSNTVFPLRKPGGELSRPDAGRPKRKGLP